MFLVGKLSRKCLGLGKPHGTAFTLWMKFVSQCLKLVRKDDTPAEAFIQQEHSFSKEKKTKGGNSTGLWIGVPYVISDITGTSQ